MGITGGSPLALEGCVYAVDVLPVCPSQELSCWGPSLNHNSFVLQPQYQQWVLDLLMAKYPGRCGGPRTMCLGRIELEKDRGLFWPLLIHWWLWLIIFGEFYHRALPILRKHYLQIYQNDPFFSMAMDIALAFIPSGYQILTFFMDPQLMQSH